MTKNTLMDLNNHLFEQLERLNDEDLSGENLDKELKRTEGMVDIANTIVANAATVIKAAQVYDNVNDANTRKPKFLE